jgi:lysophospholipase L1-like esterase
MSLRTDLLSLKASLLLVALALVGAVAVAASLTWPFRLELDRERFFAVQAAIRDTPNPVIIFGDSIVEGAALPSKVCGLPLVNAGVRGAGIGYFLRHSAQLLGSSRPSLIVLAVGMNNAAAKENRQVDFESRYEKVVASLADRAPVAVATVTPIKEGYFVSTYGYDPQIVPALNRTILAAPNVRAVIDLNAPLSGANFTVDGVHLNAAGYALWTGAVLKGVEAALGCVRKDVAAQHQDRRQLGRSLELSAASVGG